MACFLDLRNSTPEQSHLFFILDHAVMLAVGNALCERIKIAFSTTTSLGGHTPCPS